VKFVGEAEYKRTKPDSLHGTLNRDFEALFMGGRMMRGQLPIEPGTARRLEKRGPHHASNLRQQWRGSFAQVGDSFTFFDFLRTKSGR
jgi:hypothetical protein